MSKRKANNCFARAERNCRALVRSNHVAVINIEPGDYQWMINWKNRKIIRSKGIVDALLHVTHRWTIFAAVLCEKPDGERYMKAKEFTTEHLHLVTNLEDLIQESIEDLQATANLAHLRNRAWIAIPDAVSLTEAQAAQLFSAVEGWAPRVEAA
jgi:hypothetical protein